MPKLADKTLSDARLRKLKPRSKRYEVPDGVVRGMSLRMSPKGTMTFFQTSRDQFGKRIRAKLGRYPNMSLKDARTEAIQTSKEIEAGTHLDRHKPRQCGEVYSLWLDRDQAGNRSINNVRSAINVHVLPKFADRPIDSITRADIHQLLDEITDNGTPTQANRVYAHLRRMFNYAVERGYTQANPMNGMKRPNPERSRDRVISPEELSQIWNAATDLGHPFGSLFLLLILTGQRLQEVANTTWSEIDLSEGVWRLPGARTKNGKPHIVHLSPQAIEIISALPRTEDVDFLFTTTGRTPVSGFSKFKRKLDQESGIADWVIHDLRRTFATHTTERLGANPVVVDKVLNHVSGAVTGVAAVYQRGKYLKQRQRLMDDWANFLDRSHASGNNVVHIVR